MNRREFIAASTGLLVASQLPNIEVRASAPTPLEPPNPYNKKPVLTYDLTTGTYHGHRCCSQFYFYESEMPPAANRKTLSEQMEEYMKFRQWSEQDDEYNEYVKWSAYRDAGMIKPPYVFPKKWETNPPPKPSGNWDGYSFNFEKFKNLLDISNRPFVFFPFERPGQIHLIFAGLAYCRYEYVTTTTKDQAWQVFGSDLPCRIWLRETLYTVTKGLSMTHWSNPGYPITMWSKEVREGLVNLPAPPINES
jgi:hypothetical protein